MEIRGFCTSFPLFHCREGNHGRETSPRWGFAQSDSALTSISHSHTLLHLPREKYLLLSSLSTCLHLLTLTLFSPLSPNFYSLSLLELVHFLELVIHRHVSDIPDASQLSSSLFWLCSQVFHGCISLRKCISCWGRWVYRGEKKMEAIVKWPNVS